MSDRKLTQADCLIILKEKYTALKEQGVDRYPKRADFTDSEVVAIKAFLGSWPRALEAAGIKPPRNDDRIQRNREKRIRAKRRRTMALKKLKKEKLNHQKSENELQNNQ